MRAKGTKNQLDPKDFRFRGLRRRRLEEDEARGSSLVVPGEFGGMGGCEGEGFGGRGGQSQPTRGM